MGLLVLIVIGVVLGLVFAPPAVAVLAVIGIIAVFILGFGTSREHWPAKILAITIGIALVAMIAISAVVNNDTSGWWQNVKHDIFR